jgi:hypothetical protein
VTPQELATLREIHLLQHAIFNLLAEVMGQVSGRTVKAVFVLQDNALYEFKGETSLISLMDAPPDSCDRPPV